jgi:hypothetical protein
MKLKLILAFDTLRGLRPRLSHDTWLTVYRAMEAYCARYQTGFKPYKWRAYVDRA